MSRLARVGCTLGVAVAAMIAAAVEARAQNHAPNPYRTVDGWAQAPPGRPWGATSAVYPARDGSGNIWVAERCGENTCVGKDELPVILLFNQEGRIVRSFAASVSSASPLL